MPEIAAWRERMKTEDAKRVYRSRAGLCELVNAHFKSHHGAAHVLVRGLEKVTCVALLGALANNLLANERILAPQLTTTRPATTRPSRSARPEGRACFNPSCPGIYPGGSGS